MSTAKTETIIVGVPDDERMVSMGPNERIPIEDLKDAVTRYADTIGGRCFIDGEGRLVLERPAPDAPGTAPREYEGHPNFHERVTVVGRSAFTVRGPVEPVASGVPGGLVLQRGALFVELPDVPGTRWYSRSYEIEYPLGRTPKFAAKEFGKLERAEIEKAEKVLTELGLGVTS